MKPLTQYPNPGDNIPMSNHSSLHAHIATESSDCDGRYSRTYIEVMRDDEAESEWADLDFQARVLGSHVGFHESGELTFNSNGFNVHTRTDEGYRDVTVDWCTDDDTDERGTFRDHRAESMGY